MLLPPRVAPHQVIHLDLADLQMEAERSHAAAYDAARDRILVRACLLELAPADRELLELCLFHGWSVEEIARYLGQCQSGLSARITEHIQRLEQRHGVVLASAVASRPRTEPRTEPQPRPREWPTTRSA